MTPDIPRGSELIHAAQTDNTQAVLVYLEKGGDINARNEHSGDHVLSAAVLYGHESMFNFLIQKNADLNAQDKWGKTILFYDRCTPKMFKIALENSADPNIKDTKGRTALMQWIQDRPSFVSSQSYRVALLLKYGAQVDSADNEGKTVHDYAEGWLKKYLKMDTDELEKEIAAYC